MIYAFVICQFLVVLFIAVHDWVPLGRLNSVAGIRAVDSPSKLAVVTVLSTLPFAIALVASVHYANSSFPMWLMWLLWCSYGAALYGVLRTWWVPYLFAKNPAGEMGSERISGMQ
ncbi:MAG TPA: hypothetical protein VJR90_00445 [Gammaproteobacteria bacterium]|nr:hypothetical protein [Gammaproteobacteria bacterium]